MNPYITMLMNPRDPRLFYGRNIEIAWLLQLISADQPSLCSIVGFKGIGKTSILNYLAHEEGAFRDPKYIDCIGPKFKDNPDKLISVYLDLAYSSEDVAEFVEKQHLFLRITKALFEQLGGKISEFDVSKFEANIECAQPDVFHTLTLVLDELVQLGIRVVFLLDNFDSLKGKVRTQDLDKFLVLGQCASFVYTSENPLDELDDALLNESFWLSIVSVNGFLGLMPEDEAKDLIRGPAQSVGVDILLSDAEFVVQAIGRHPYLILLACEPIFEQRKCDERTGKEELSQGEKNLIIIRVREQSKPFFHALWRRLTEDEYEALFQLIQNDVGLSSQILRQLCRKALIYYDQHGNPKFFSELFTNFVASAYSEHRQVYSKKVAFNEELSLTPKERLILEYLSARPGQFCSKEELLQVAWGDNMVSAHAVEVTVQRLKEKLRKVPGESIGEIDGQRLRGYRYLLVEIKRENVQ